MLCTERYFGIIVLGNSAQCFALRVNAIVEIAQLPTALLFNKCYLCVKIGYAY